MESRKEFEAMAPGTGGADLQGTGSIATGRVRNGNVDRAAQVRAQVRDRDGGWEKRKVRDNGGFVLD